MNKSIKKYHKIVCDINIKYETLHSLTNDELRMKLRIIEQVIRTLEDKDYALEENLVTVFAIVKETARRFSEGNIEVTATPNDIRLSEKYDFIEICGDKAIYKNHWDVMGVPYAWNMVHYDEQLLGGILLHYGYATEMATGEGKTLVATLPVFLNALTHDGVHIMTVNNYLSQRDYEITRPIYMLHGLSADCIEISKTKCYERKEAYKSDIVFGANSTFTFDYLFDHIAISPKYCVQQNHNYAIIDELDSVLIDNADEPHIISGENTYDNSKIFKENYSLVKELIEYEDAKLYEKNFLNKTASFTNEGKKWLSNKKSMPDLYSIERTYEVKNFKELTLIEQDEIRKKIYLQNVLNQLLLALTVYERDVDYLIDDNKVKIIDPHTGRIKESSRWEHGLHTAIEVKENVQVQYDSDSMAVISLKNYFRLYNKIAGMSGTIMPVKEELMQLYNLQCASLPTHKPIIRKDTPLRIFKTAQQKDDAIVQSIVTNMEVGRPSLVGSISIKRSEQISAKLDKKGIIYHKLNAKTLKDESNIIAKAGIKNTVTISTNVAGRGTDIKLSTEAISAGGLVVIGTDLFESVRVDNQLKGRSGRQGDPGSSVFFASLEDRILKNLETDELIKLKQLSSTYQESEISKDEIRKYFYKAQANREAYFKSLRKETARKDDIVAPFRKKFYEQRNAVLFEADAAVEIVSSLIRQYKISPEDIDNHLNLLYLKIKELVIRSIKNNTNRSIIWIPFSESKHTFAIALEIEQTIESYEYFCHEFERQIILQIYDKEWKKFVLHILSNLDQKEINMLEDKYIEMMSNINNIIINKLLNSVVIFNEVNSDNINLKKITPTTQKSLRHPKIASDDPCPCKSGKKYCECHGNNIRSKYKSRHR